MKKNLLLLLCLFCLVNVCHAKAKDTFTVFQLNLWHGCTKVPNGDQGIIDVLKTVVDPTLDELAILGGVVIVRTVLSVFLNKEIKELAEEENSKST